MLLTYPIWLRNTKHRSLVLFLLQLFYTEIKSLSGEPDYKSVNLTWEIEPVDDDQQQDDGGAAQQPLPTPAFQVYYCEMQSWGPQRCKSKVLSQQQQDEAQLVHNEGNNIDSEDRNGREFSLVIDNLRMATKYSFHVRQLAEGVDVESLKPKARRIDQQISQNDLEKGEMIIIPTKGCEY